MRKTIVAMLIACTSIYALEGSGTYNFPKSLKQSVLNVYVRKPGYMNIDIEPIMCGKVSILDRHNKNIRTALVTLNVKVDVGTYKIIVIPKNSDCTLNVLLPE